VTRNKPIGRAKFKLPSERSVTNPTPKRPKPAGGYIGQAMRLAGKPSPMNVCTVCKVYATKNPGEECSKCIGNPMRRERFAFTEDQQAALRTMIQHELAMDRDRPSGIVPSEPTEVEVEELARVIYCENYKVFPKKWGASPCQEHWRRVAAAALAHLRSKP